MKGISEDMNKIGTYVDKNGKLGTEQQVLPISL